MSRDPAAWRKKTNEWFMPELNWRGLSYKDQEVGDADILNMFKELHRQMTSNAVARETPGKTTEQIRELALKDFDRYNQDLYLGDVHKMAKDHSETGPLYGESYGYSTSKNRTVGKAFAMGAMVFAKYGEQAAPEIQAQIKSRILIGVYRGIKDVDLGRLHSIDERFWYAYGRQQEVMGIGAADPDSVMIVQKLAATGQVDLSYVRDPKEPGKVWVVEGQWPPGDSTEITEPPPERVQTKVSLWPETASTITH
jgi:hypothetical protein